MAKDELNAFLSAGAGAPDVAPAEPTPEPAPSPDAPASDAKPEPQQAAKPEPDDDAEPPEAQAGEAVVPRRALEDERHKRQDWKVKATKAETERDELRKQFEELKRAQAAPPQPAQAPPPLQPINPAEDPQGYHQRIQGVMLNERLNVSELLLREKLGDEKVDQLVAEFRQAATEDPSLTQKLYSNPNPYAWAHKQMERLRLQRDIGDDPSAYEAKLRAKWEAERVASTPEVPAAPVVRQAPSLATARSVAGRSAPSFQGPPPLDDILAAGREQRRSRTH